MHRASILVICMLLGACAGGDRLTVRPATGGFAAGGSAIQPLQAGRHDLAAGRNGLAIRRFGEVLGREPRSLEALNGIAVAYTRIGRHDVAQGYFERALQVEPRDAATLNNYARSLIEQGRYRDARPFLAQALRHAREDDVPVIAANLLTIREAGPPRILTAMKSPEAEPAGGRLVRVGADRYRLQTGIVPATWAAPAVTRQRQARRPAQVRLVPLSPRKPRLEGLRLTVLARRDPPRPALKPLRLGPVAAAARSLEPALVRLEAAPPDPATVRALIAERLVQSDFAGFLDGILNTPADALPAPAAGLGEPT